MDKSQTKIRRMSDRKCDDFVPGTPTSRLALVWPLTCEAASLSKNHDVKQR